MNMRAFSILIGMMTSIVATPATAGVITLTGYELLSHPDATFPTTEPTTNGAWLKFGPSETDYANLLVFSLADIDATNFTITANLTRLTDDHDPYLVLGDGNNFVGAVIGDNLGGEFNGVTLSDEGVVGDNRVLHDVFDSAGYPVIGDPFEVVIDFTLTNLYTSVEVNLFGSSGVFMSSDVVLDPLADLEFVFMRENDAPEEYQINSLSIAWTESIPEPDTLAVFLIGLVGIGLALRGRRRSAFGARRRYVSTVLLTVMIASTSIPATAGVVTLTGADLYDDPSVTFPTTQPTLDGSSLIFGPSNTGLEELLVFSLGHVGEGTVSVTANLTHLACTGSCVGDEDFDPHFLIGDGNNYVGAVIADNVGGQFLGTTMTDSGTVGTNRTLDSVFTGAGYPAIGETFDVYIDFLITSTLTTVNVSFLSGTGTFNSSSIVIDPLADLGFVFMRDNDAAEQYQINSLRIASPSIVPEPGTFALFGIGLAGIGVIGRRRRNA